MGISDPSKFRTDGRFIDLTWKRFGMLIGLMRAPNDGNKHSCWLFRCDCGATKVIRSQSVRIGNTISCGCFMAQSVAIRHTTHGLSKDPCYQVWHAMMSRCYDEENSNYKNYGGRGISVCERWKTMELFISDNSPRPEGMSIDRINVNGNYEPGNVRWATDEMQNRNRRDSMNVMFDGQEMPATHASIRLGGSTALISSRLKKGWTLEEAISAPVGSKRKK